MWLILMIILVPAPKDEPLPFIGKWDVVWGNSEQTMEFLKDGTYLCPKYGNGTWTIESNVIYFNEGNAFYGMVIDWDIGEGFGFNRGYESNSQVKLKRKIP